MKHDEGELQEHLVSSELKNKKLMKDFKEPQVKHEKMCVVILKAAKQRMNYHLKNAEHSQWLWTLAEKSLNMCMFSRSFSRTDIGQVKPVYKT